MFHQQRQMPVLGCGATPPERTSASDDPTGNDAPPEILMSPPPPDRNDDDEQQAAPPPAKVNDARRMILERRARFVAAALSAAGLASCGRGTGASVCLSFAPDDDPTAPTAGPLPTPCLSMLIPTTPPTIGMPQPPVPPGATGPVVTPDPSALPGNSPGVAGAGGAGGAGGAAGAAQPPAPTMLETDDVPEEPPPDAAPPEGDAGAVRDAGLDAGSADTAESPAEGGVGGTRS